MMIGDEASFDDNLVTVVGSVAIVKLFNKNYKIDVDYIKMDNVFEIRRAQNPRNLLNLAERRSKKG